jgi:hypothetical protein
MARSFEERQVTEEIIDKEHRNVCIRWPNSWPCRIGLLLESRVQRRLFRSCRMTHHSESAPGEFRQPTSYEWPTNRSEPH